jgi:hypothetical protein
VEVKAWAKASRKKAAIAGFKLILLLFGIYYPEQRAGDLKSPAQKSGITYPG